MGDWSDRAAKRFHEQASERRKAEELKIQRDAKTQAGAKARWKELVAYVGGQVKDFNTLMGRQFLELQSFENEVEVHAPKLWLKFWIDVGVLDIKFAFQKPFPSLKQTQSGQFALALKAEQVCITDADGLALSVATVGEIFLDPLVA